MFNYKFLTSIDVSMFKHKLHEIENDWDEFNWRQETFEVHQQTKTVPLIFDKDFRINNPTYHINYNVFESQMEDLKDVYKEKIGPGYIIRAILVMLPAKSAIAPHIDKGTSLTLCVRTHIPLVTHKDVLFNIDNEEKHLKEGEIWEINNAHKYHSVINKSNKDRIHLIVDWIKND